MERRRFLSLIASGVVATSLYNCQAPKSSKPPNLIFILADDLGIGDLECFGGRRIETPNLNKMADEGMRFTHFYSAAAVCSPTRVSCLTGRYPLRFNITRHFNDREMHLPANVSTLPKLLKESDYVSMHIGKWHLGGLNVKHCENRECSIPGPLQHGFDHYLCMYEDPQIRAKLIQERRLYREGANYLVRNDEPVEEVNKHWTDYKIEQALKFIEQKNQTDQPFFLNLWFDVPHTPYEPAPKPHISPYQNRAHGDDLLYRSMVDHLDYGVGEVLDKLKELDIQNNTLVIFTSDNGPSHQGSPGPLKGRKCDLHEGGIHMPMIAWWPGKIKSDTVCEELTVTNDILATMCAAANISIPADVRTDGINLLPAMMNGETIQNRTVFWKMDIYRGFYDAVTDEKPEPVATEVVRHGKWKMLAKGGEALELFNLQEDPYERWNLIKWEPEMVAKLTRELRAWLGEI